jgi:DNA-binding beta-propeller fold protein YncE
MMIGEGRHRYRFERDWARLPRWWSFGENGPGLPPQTAVQGAVSAEGDVYVLSRSAHPVMVFDGDGGFVTSWGEGLFSPFVHGLSIDPAGHVWITDTGKHSVSEFTSSGAALRQLGDRPFAAPTFYGAPFNMPTGVAFASSGDIYVSDGYGNRRVHRFAPDGTLKHSWGGPGAGPGEFALVHFIGIDAQDRVYICDRENDRIQVFDGEGGFVAAWTDFTRPSDIAFGREHIFVGGQDGLSIWTHDRQKVVRWGRDDPFKEAFNIHGIWLDGEDNIFLAHFDRVVSKLTRV